MDITKDAVVGFHYRVTVVGGDVVDQSATGEPMVYLHGRHQIIPGLEAALAGHQAGEHIDTEISADSAYGPYDDQLDLVLPLDAFPEEARSQVQPGFRFVAEHPTQDGQEVMFTVQGLEGDRVMISGNHPLAGKALAFSVDIVSVRLATAEELAHGHAHGAGGHHHH